MTKPTEVQPPRAAKSDIHRLSENGGRAVQWGLETDYAQGRLVTDHRRG